MDRHWLISYLEVSISMSSKQVKLKSGIPGFDSIISGGIPEGSSVTISGPSGSGKTTFGMQFLYNGAKDFDEPGVFVSLSESLDQLKSDFAPYGWDLDKLIEQEKLLVIDARPFKMDEGFVAQDESLFRGESLPYMNLTQLILSSLKRISAKRLVIDSLTVLATNYTNEFYTQQGLQAMIYALDKARCTALLLSESSDPQKVPLEWFVTTGIVYLYHERREETMKRSVQVLKMKGVRHAEQIFPIKLGESGLEVLHPRINP